MGGEVDLGLFKPGGEEIAATGIQVGREKSEQRQSLEACGVLVQRRLVRALADNHRRSPEHRA